MMRSEAEILNWLLEKILDLEDENRDLKQLVQILNSERLKDENINIQRE